MQDVLRNYPYVNYHIINRKVISLFLCVHREGEGEGERGKEREEREREGEGEGEREREREREGEGERERERDPTFTGCCKLHALIISVFCSVK